MTENERDSITSFSSGCPTIDKTLGGGIRLGQVTEVYGESGCGKNTIMRSNVFGSSKNISSSRKRSQ